MSKKRRNESYDYLRRTYGVAGTGGQNRAGQGAGANSGKGAELTSGPSRVPARMIETVESTECIVGYREWSLYVTYPDGWLLYSNGNTVWTPFKKIAATCKPTHDVFAMSITSTTITTSTSIRGRYLPEPHIHRSPDPAGHCYCGINAWRDRIAVRRSETPSVIGSVNLWGSVIEYPEGYRGQYAYPQELAVVGNGDKDRLAKIATKLELAYGVPCQVWE